ncbi:hypothetical protein [Mesorhizobium dulcispinae]|uniref:hypothetical protein n=1 Tax=Mesorhizobium dulcispinae TaxID=3072316 RepID=UPI002A24B50F|nr:hypothetical protein [Mesorhizobium sp. VK23D]MDX8521309.1 hypothetical protein [Mesorhizobium sp. VK23D]
MENLDSADQAEGRVAANDNRRGHVNPVMDRAKSGRLFDSPADNLLAVRTLNRMDELLSRAESENAYPKWLEGKADHEDYFGQDESVECEGRSAEKIIEDYFNGPMAMHERAVAAIPGKEIGKDQYGLPEFSPPIERAYCSTAQSGRFKFNQAGIIIGYRLNKNPLNGDDIWVERHGKKYPDNAVNPRQKKQRDPRLRDEGRTYADDLAPSAANDNFAERATIAWIKERMAPGHYDAVYDATAGQGFGAIGRAAGFSGKQADAVGKDRVRCGVLAAARLLEEYDDAG